MRERGWADLQTLGLLGAVGFLTAFGAHVIVAGLPAYGRVHGLGYRGLGLLLAAYNLAEILAKPLAGRVGDRLGARPVMFWGTAFFALSCLAYLVMPPGSLAGLRVCQGIGAGALSVSSLVLVAGSYPRHLGRAMGIYGGLKSAGYVCAPLVGGWFTTGADLRGPFLAAGLAGIVVLALQAALRLEPEPRPAGSGPRGSRARLWPWYLANFVDMALLGVLLGFLPMRADALGYDPGAIGLLLSGTTVAFLIAQPVCGALADRLGRRPVILAGLALGALGTGLLGLTTGWPLHLAGIITGSGLGAAWANSLARVGERAAGGKVGGDLGLAGSCKDAGDIAGPLALGFLAARYGLAGAFGCWGLVGLLAVAAVAAGSKAEG